MSQSTNHRARNALLMVLIIMVAFFLRLWNINKESFWADEGWTMVLAKGPTLADVVVTMAQDQHPPLYFVLIHSWMRLVGNSEIMVRLLSTFWSLIGVACLYRLGRELFGETTGLIAALVLALTDNDIMLAQETRHYAQMAALAVASGLFYFRYWRTRSRRDGVGWLLSSLALMYTHYLGGFVLIVQLTHLLLYARPVRQLADMFFRWVLIGVGWLPWGVVFLGQSLVRYDRPVIFQSALPNAAASFNIIRGDLIGTNFALTGVLLFLGLVYVAYHNGQTQVSIRPFSSSPTITSRSWPTVYLALWLIIPIVTIVAINQRFPIMTTRNFLIVTPPIALLIAHGVSNLDHFARRIVLLAFVAASLLWVDAYHIKPPYRQLTQDILQHRVDNEPVIMDIWVDDFALRYHLGRALNVDPDTLPLVSMWQWREQFKENYFAELLNYIQDKPAVWLAYWAKDEDKLLEFFPAHGFTRTATFIEYHLGEPIYAYRYDRVPTTGLTRFGDVLELMKADVDVQGRRVRVNLVFKALNKPAVDYSISVFALHADGTLAVQSDASPLDGQSPTSSWQAGDLRFDSHTFQLPSSAPQDYTIGIKVYWYQDPTPLAVSAGQHPDYFVITP